MFNFLKQKSGSYPLKVEVFDDYFSINDIKFTDPFHLNDVINIFGEPDYHEHNLVWHAAWHQAGIYLEYATWDHIFEICFQLQHSPKSKHRPKKMFKGQVFVKGQAVDLTKAIDIPTEQLKVRVYGRRDEDVLSALSVGRNWDYKAKRDPKKYMHKKTRSKPLIFEDFNFKLAVIQELMYHQHILKPQFDLYDFVDWYEGRDIDIEDEGYEQIAEVTQWFKNLPITKAQAAKITEISMDGGNSIYGHVFRFWDGECDEFDITNTADLKHLPNLKTIKYFGLSDSIIAEFEAQGVEIKSI